MLIPFHSLVSEDWGSPVLRIWYFFFLLGHGFGFCELGFPPILRIWYFFFPTRAWFYSIWYLIHVTILDLPYSKDGHVWIDVEICRSSGLVYYSYNGI